MGTLSISDVSDIVSIAGTMGAALAGVWGLCRWRNDKKMAQSEFLEGLINQFADDEILRLICSLDSDEEVYEYFRNPTEPQNRKVIEKSLNLLSPRATYPSEIPTPPPRRKGCVLIPVDIEARERFIGAEVHLGRSYNPLRGYFLDI